MEFSIKLHTIYSGWSIVYNEESQGNDFTKNILFLSLKMDFVLANSADPDEMPHCVAFHLGLHCLPKYPFRGWSKTAQLLPFFRESIKIKLSDCSVIHFCLILWSLYNI